MKSDSVYIYNILESIELLEKYLKGVSLVEFKKRKMLMDAVAKRVENMGENVSKISEKTKKKYPQVDWVTLKLNRNFLIHVYESAKPERLYYETKDSLPKLKIELKKIMECLK